LTLVDANVLLDLVTKDSVWSAWSAAALNDVSIDGPLVINAVIYAELSTRYTTIETLDDFVSGIGLQLIELPRTSLFLAAKVFRRYRSSGGIKTGVLPDFFIGAHASVLDLPILTRDVRRYRSYFPAVRLISPQMI
jgi:predicted nucleic acid-binding protein